MAPWTPKSGSGMFKNLATLKILIVNCKYSYSYYSSVQNQLVPERITCKTRPTNEKFKANVAQL